MHLEITLHKVIPLKVQNGEKDLFCGQWHGTLTKQNTHLKCTYFKHSLQNQNNVHLAIMVSITQAIFHSFQWGDLFNFKIRQEHSICISFQKQFFFEKKTCTQHSHDFLMIRADPSLQALPHCFLLEQSFRCNFCRRLW